MTKTLGIRAWVASRRVVQSWMFQLWGRRRMQRTKDAKMDLHLCRSITGPISVPYSSFRGFTGPSAFANLLKIRV